VSYPDSCLKSSCLKSILACSVLGLLLTGCTATQFKNPFAKNSSQNAAQFAKGRKTLKNPQKVYLAYAKVQEQTGNVKDARASYHAVLEEDPQSVDAMLGLARLDHLAGRTEKAEFSFQRALKLRKNDPNTLDAIGQFYASQKEWNKAVKHLNQAALASPKEPLYRYHLAVALARSGDIDAAMPHFVKTVGDAQAHYNIGFIMQEEGRTSEAAQQYQIALSKKPDLLAARNKLAELQQGDVVLTNAQTPQFRQTPNQQPVQSYQPQQAAHQQWQTNSPLTPEKAIPQPLLAKVWREPVKVQKLPPVPQTQMQQPNSTSAPAPQQHPNAMQPYQQYNSNAPQRNYQPQQWQPQPSFPPQQALPPPARTVQPVNQPGYPQPPAGLTPQQLEQWNNQFAPAR